jgi:non-heme chloroperoxidase
MPVITVGTENSGAIDLHYEDYGSGAPVILIHGYPLNGRAWDKQLPPLLAAGRRVITYDRRGAAGSSQPATGYDWDTFAADLAALIDRLGLQRVTLVGHFMGTGGVTRYLSTYGSAKVDRAVLIGPIPPFFSQAPDNPDGVAIAAYACVATCQADFRGDLPKIDVPVMVIQGDADRILPFEKTGKRLPELIANLDLVVIEGGPHAVPWTHTDQVNAALLRFLGHAAA